MDAGADARRNGALKRKVDIPKGDSRESSSFQLGETHRKAGKYKEAIKVFDGLLAVNGKHVQALAGRAAAKRAIGMQESAVADYEAALLLEARNPALLASLGIVKSELGWFGDAMGDFEAALRIEPGHSLAANGKNMTAWLQNKAPTRIITLAGFQRVPAMNNEFEEQRADKFKIGGRETFWSHDREVLIYWCTSEFRWKACRTVDLPKLRNEGRSVGFASSPQGQSILAPSLSKGWHEWSGSSWTLNPFAGVASISPCVPRLRSFSLSGFTKLGINTTYTERRQLDFVVNDRETYWSSDGNWFVFWCKTENRWLGSMAEHLERVQEGTKKASYFSAPTCLDFLTTSKKRGWYEWSGKQWTLKEDAGLVKVEPPMTSLRTLTLAGFRKRFVNGVYKECRDKHHIVNSRETYQAENGMSIIFWSQQEKRWKITSTDQLDKIKAGSAIGFAGAPQSADVLSPSLLRGWHEWYRQEWIYRQTAGVVELGVVSTGSAKGAVKDSRPSTTTNGTKPAVPARRELIRRAFVLFDLDRDQRLKLKELRSFANCTGFDGSDEEWAEEYKTLCLTIGTTPERGMDEALFTKLVSDQSDDGCYCSNEELADILGLAQG